MDSIHSTKKKKKKKKKKKNNIQFISSNTMYALMRKWFQAKSKN